METRISNEIITAIAILGYAIVVGIVYSLVY
jgi:hypothetical protein